MKAPCFGMCQFRLRIPRFCFQAEQSLVNTATLSACSEETAQTIWLETAIVDWIRSSLRTLRSFISDEGLSLQVKLSSLRGKKSEATMELLTVSLPKLYSITQGGLMEIARNTRRIMKLLFHWWGRFIMVHCSCSTQLSCLKSILTSTWEANHGPRGAHVAIFGLINK